MDTRRWQIVARGIAQSYGIKVMTGSPRTNGKVIYLPITDAPEAELHGYLDHEAAHCLFTDFEAGREEKASLPGFHSLENLLEDIRIEAAMGRRYPGSRRNLARTAKAVAGKHDGMDTQSLSPLGAVMMSLFSDLRTRVLGQECPRNQSVYERANELLSGAYKKVLAVASQVKFAQSTEEVQKIALQVYGFLRDLEAPEEPQAPQAPQGSDGSGDSEGSEGESEGGSADEDSDEDEEDESAGEPDDADDSTDADDSGGGGDSDQSKPEDSDESEENEAGANPADADDSADGGYAPSKFDQELSEAEQEATDPVARIKREMQEQAGEGGSAGGAGGAEIERIEPDPVRQDLPVEVRAMERRLETLLDETTQPLYHTAPRGKRLKNRALHRAATANPNIFRRTLRAAPGVGGNVLVLIDQSGSMDGEKAKTAAESAIATVRAISNMGVRSMVLGFGAGPNGGTTLLKDWDDPCPQGFAPLACGGTPLAAALSWAGASLAWPPAPEEKKVVITITDGYPNDTGACEEQMRLLESEGAELLFVSIGCDSELYGSRAHCIVESVTELPARFAEMVFTAIRRAA